MGGAVHEAGIVPMRPRARFQPLAQSTFAPDTFTTCAHFFVSAAM